MRRQFDNSFKSPSLGSIWRIVLCHDSSKVQSIQIWLKKITDASSNWMFAYLIISTTMPSSSALRKFDIAFNARSNSSSTNIGIDWIIFLSSSVVVGRRDDENNVPMNEANSSASMTHIDDRIGVLLIFLRYLVFSNFWNKFSIHFVSLIDSRSRIWRE